MASLSSSKNNSHGGVVDPSSMYDSDSGGDDGSCGDSASSDSLGQMQAFGDVLRGSLSVRQEEEERQRRREFMDSMSRHPPSSQSGESGWVSSGSPIGNDNEGNDRFDDEHDDDTDMESGLRPAIENADGGSATGTSAIFLVQRDEDGNSLPPPESMFGGGSRSSSNDATTSDAALLPLNENGNSLPAVEELLVHDTPGVRSSFLPLDENGNSLPSAEELKLNAGGSTYGRSSAAQRLQALGQSVLSKLPSLPSKTRDEPASSLHSNAVTPREEEQQLRSEVESFLDEEDGRDRGTDDVDDDIAPFPYEDDLNDNEKNAPNTSKKRGAKNASRDDGVLGRLRKYSSRRVCLVMALVLLYLVMFISLVYLAATRRQPATAIAPVTDGQPSAIAPATDTPSPAPTQENSVCQDEIILLDKNGNDIIIPEDSSVAAACYTTSTEINFRFKRCNPTSTEDWIGVFPSSALYFDRLWRPFYAATYLCDGGLPCSVEALNSMPLMNKNMTAPAIETPGEYRFFLVLDSYWPYQYISFTPPFRIVEGDSCTIVEVNQNNSTWYPTSIGTQTDKSNDDFVDQIGDLVGDLAGNTDLGDQFGDMVGDLIGDVEDDIFQDNNIFHDDYVIHDDYNTFHNDIFQGSF